MRRVLLAGVALAALAMPLRPANAILGVGDLVFDPATHAEAVAMVATLKDQLTTAQSYLRTAQDGYSLANRAYNARNSISGMAGLVDRYVSPLPQGYSLQGTINSANGIAGDVMGGRISSLMSRFGGSGYTRYEPTGDAFQDTETRRQREVLQKQMAEQQAIYESIEERQRNLGIIEAASRNANTEAEKNDVNRAFSSEMAHLQGLQIQVANLNAQAVAERENNVLRIREERSRDLDTMYDQLLEARGARLGLRTAGTE